MGSRRTQNRRLKIKGLTALPTAPRLTPLSQRTGSAMFPLGRNAETPSVWSAGGHRSVVCFLSPRPSSDVWLDSGFRWVVLILLNTRGGGSQERARGHGGWGSGSPAGKEARRRVLTSRTCNCTSQRSVTDRSRSARDAAHRPAAGHIGRRPEHEQPPDGGVGARGGAQTPSACESRHRVS